MIADRSFALPLLGLTKQGVQMEGAALIRGKDNKCVGTLSGEQTLGMNYIIGKKLKVSLLFVKNQLITYEVHKLRRKIKVSTEHATKPKFDIHVFTEGTLAELHFNEPKQVMNEKVLKKELSKEMKKRIEKSIQLVQKNIR